MKKISLIVMSLFLTSFVFMGCGGSEDSFEDSLLDAPTGLRVTNITSDSVSLSWNPVAGATTYFVEYNSYDSWSGFTTQDCNFVAPGTSNTSITIELWEDTEFIFAVRAHDGRRTGRFSSPVRATTE